MIHAYSELYLNDAQKTLGTMFDYVVYDCEYDIDWFADLFVKSGYARQFERGNPAIISGMSGVELANRVIEYAYNNPIYIPATQPTDRTPEYWAGWALADYQWYSCCHFNQIFERIKMSEITDMYNIYHEMDISHFRETMDSLMAIHFKETNLKKIRVANGISQRELSALSGVSLRSIQMYEQRKNNIDRAEGQTLYKLSIALGCQIEDLLEQPNR